MPLRRGKVGLGVGGKNVCTIRTGEKRVCTVKTGERMLAPLRWGKEGLQHSDDVIGVCTIALLGS